MKLFLTLCVLVGLGIGAIWSVDTILSVDDLRGCEAPGLASGQLCAPADAIVAISGGDTSARTAEAVKLYRKGWAPRLIFSGAALDTSGPSNAEVMRRQAIEAGVPDSAITLEKFALDTAQNAQLTSALLGQDVHRVILVTSPYHQRRASIEFQRTFGTDVTIINHPANQDRFWPNYWWLTTTGWWLALSEVFKTLVVLAWR